MSEIDQRVAALLQTPLACAFLLIAAESGLTAKEIAQPDIALDLGAFAVFPPTPGRGRCSSRLWWAMRYVFGRPYGLLDNGRSCSSSAHPLLHADSAATSRKA